MDGRSVDGPGASRGLVACRRVNVVLLCGLVAVLALARQAAVGGAGGNSIVLWGHEFPHTCLTERLTGAPCPGCGLTRSVVLTLDGEFAAARAMHPSGIWVVAWLFGQVLARLGGVVWPGRFRTLWVADLVVSLATFWLAIYVPMLPGLFRH
jgi:hypothetical protein